MASFTYNIGSKGLQDRSVDFINDTIELVFLKSSYTPDKDHTGGTPAASEITGVSGYTGGFGGAGRKVLGTKAIVNDTANDRTTYGAADPSSYGNLGTGDTIGWVLVQKKGSASDATAVPLFLLDVTDTPTNGGPVAIAFPSGLIGWTQQ